MNKIIISLISVFLLSSTSVFAIITDLHPPMSSSERSLYEKKVNQQLKQSKNKVSTIMVKMGKGGKIISPAARIKLEAAKTAHLAKLNLTQNLLQSEVIDRSPIIRQMFLDLLKQETISEVDLITFQSEINKAKAVLAD